MEPQFVCLLCRNSLLSVHRPPKVGLRAWYTLLSSQGSAAVACGAFRAQQYGCLGVGLALTLAS